MQAHEARAISQAALEKPDITTLLARIEEAARKGFFYADIGNLSLAQQNALKGLDFQVEVFGDKARVRWEE